MVRHGDRSQDRPPWNLSSSNPQYRPSYSSSVEGDPPGVPIVSLRSLPSFPALQGPSTQVHTVSPSDTEPHTPRPGYIRHLVTGPSYIGFRRLGFYSQYSSIMDPLSQGIALPTAADSPDTGNNTVPAPAPSPALQSEIDRLHNDGLDFEGDV